MKERCRAIVLAAGQGKRRGGTGHKQYLALGGQPILAHTIKVVEDHGLIDGVLLVTGADERGWVRKTIVENYVFRKVTEII